jgi:hypothetical protein
MSCRRSPRRGDYAEFLVEGIDDFVFVGERAACCLLRVARQGPYRGPGTGTPTPIAAGMRAGTSAAEGFGQVLSQLAGFDASASPTGAPRTVRGSSVWHSASQDPRAPSTAEIPRVWAERPASLPFRARSFPSKRPWAPHYLLLQLMMLPPRAPQCSPEAPWPRGERAKQVLAQALAVHRELPASRTRSLWGWEEGEPVPGPRGL